MSLTIIGEIIVKTKHLKVGFECWGLRSLAIKFQQQIITNL